MEVGWKLAGVTLALLGLPTVSLTAARTSTARQLGGVRIHGVCGSALRTMRRTDWGSAMQKPCKAVASNRSTSLSAAPVCPNIVPSRGNAAVVVHGNKAARVDAVRGGASGGYHCRRVSHLADPLLGTHGVLL